MEREVIKTRLSRQFYPGQPQRLITSYDFSSLKIGDYFHVPSLAARRGASRSTKLNGTAKIMSFRWIEIAPRRWRVEREA